MIRVRGRRYFSPTEIVTYFLAHPNISYAVVMEISSHNPSSELTRGYDVLAEPSLVVEKDVQNYTNDCLPNSNALTGGVRFVDSIPRNLSGKTLRNISRQTGKTGDDSDRTRQYHCGTDPAETKERGGEVAGAKCEDPGSSEVENLSGTWVIR